MVCIGDPDQLLRLRCGCDDRTDRLHRPIRVVVTADEELRLRAGAQTIVGIGAAFGFHRQAQRDQAAHSRIAATGLQPNGCAKRKSGEENRPLIFLLQPIERAAHVVYLAYAMVMRAFAAASAAKVEAQHGQAEAMQHLHRVVDNLVVQRAAAQRVRMADQSSVRRIGLASIQQRLQASGGAGQVQGAHGCGRRIGGGGFHAGQMAQSSIVSVQVHGLSAFGAVCWKRMPTNPVQLTRQLIDIPSVTFHEAAVGHFLAEYLAAQKFSVERTLVEQSAGGERCNVYAGIPGQTPDVVLSTHMDTVPPFFGSSEDDEYIYGRGACDAKGIIAAQICAAERLRDAGVRVGLLFVVGEERDSAGARVANQHPRGSRFLINGEPTDNRLALASKGALRAEVRAKGKMAHSAYPELGDSAIHKLVPALDRLLQAPLPVNDEVGPSTLNIGLLEGGRAPNVIADEASAFVLIRLVGPSQPVRETVKAAAGDAVSVEFTLDLPYQKFRKIEGLPTMIAAFTTDVPSLMAWGEPLLIGPGSIHVAHTPDERLAKRELFEAIDLYTEIAQRLVR